MEVVLTTVRVTQYRRYEIGERIDVTEEEAIRLIERGSAVPVREVMRESAVPKPQIERATKRRRDA